MNRDSIVGLTPGVLIHTAPYEIVLSTPSLVVPSSPSPTLVIVMGDVPFVTLFVSEIEKSGLGRIPESGMSFSIPFTAGHGFERLVCIEPIGIDAPTLRAWILAYLDGPYWNVESLSEYLRMAAEACDFVKTVKDGGLK